MNPSLIFVGNIDAISLHADEFGIRTHDLGNRMGLSAKLTTFFWDHTFMLILKKWHWCWKSTLNSASISQKLWYVELGATHWDGNTKQALLFIATSEAAVQEHQQRCRPSPVPRGHAPEPRLGGMGLHLEGGNTFKQSLQFLIWLRFEEKKS